MIRIAPMQDPAGATGPPATDGTFTDLLAQLYALIEPYQVFIAVLVVLWLLARRPPPKKEDFGRQAQDVLDEKLRRGEISRKAYEKYRQDISMRPRR